MPYSDRPRVLVKTYSIKQSGHGLKLSPNFTLGEFQSRDGADTVLVHPDLVAGLQRLRDEIDAPIVIKSGYRTRSHHEAIYNAINRGRKNPVRIPWQSEHLFGLAADIRSPGASVERIAHAARYTVGFGGVAMYKGDGFVHVDVGRTRTWAGGVPPESSQIGPVQLSAGLAGIGAGVIALALGWKPF